jgi:hypothetical protein
VAHAAGKPVGIRAGQNIDARQASMMGADFIPRSNGVGATITTSAARARGAGFGGGPNELDQWANIDEAKAADLIKVLVQQKTALIPRSTRRRRGCRVTGHAELQSRRVFADPMLMAYYRAVAPRRFCSTSSIRRTFRPTSSTSVAADLRTR